MQAARRVLQRQAARFARSASTASSATAPATTGLSWKTLATALAIGGSVAAVTSMSGMFTPLTPVECKESCKQGNPNCLGKRVAALEVEAASTRNRAFVFVKPHAVNEKVVALVKEKLAAAGVAVADEGALDAQVIDENKLIDNHYGAIASKAVLTKPAALNVPAKGQDAFAKSFGLSWSDALKQNKVYNAADACKKLNIDGAQLDSKWATLTRGKNLIKFGGGFYCGEVDGIFVINGFYMAMRSKYTCAGAKIHYMLVEWDPAQLSWEGFRGSVLGATDPATADTTSVRRAIYDQWKPLGLEAQPDVGDNGVHASASPFEALAERCNWVGATIETDAYGRGLLSAGVPAETVLAWFQDPQVLVDGTKQSLFDSLEDMNSGDCLKKAAAIQKQQP